LFSDFYRTERSSRGQKRKKKSDSSAKSKKKKRRRKSSSSSRSKSRDKSSSSSESSQQDKRKKKRTKKKKARSSSSDSSSDSSKKSAPSKNKKKDKNKKGKHVSSDSDSSEESGSDASGSSGSSTHSKESRQERSGKSAKAKKKARERKRRAEKIKCRMINDGWPAADRPDYLQTDEQLRDVTYNEAMDLKKARDAERTSGGLGEDIFRGDGVPKKVRYKAQSDNGTTKLHEARNNRQPLLHPKEWFSKVPKKWDTIIRNFPLDQYGAAGQVSPAAIGKLHNRTALLTFDSFGKTTFKSGKGGEKGAKYADQNQLEEGIMNYTTMIHALWPMDYNAFAIWRVVNEAQYGALVTTDEKKRSDIVIEFFNAVLVENCGRAVHGQHPMVFEEVR
jgi:hypothetical protein